MCSLSKSNSLLTLCSAKDGQISIEIHDSIYQVVSTTELAKRASKETTSLA